MVSPNVDIVKLIIFILELLSFFIENITKNNTEVTFCLKLLLSKVAEIIEHLNVFLF